MKIKAIIFDMGGVLVDLDLEACKEAFRKLGYEEIDSIIDACHQKGIWGDMESGLITDVEFRNEVISKSRPGTSPEDVDRAVGKILAGIAPHKVSLLNRLARSYDLYMLSNNNPIALSAAERMLSEAGLDMGTCFRKCYLSYRMKMLKPSAGFYRAVMDDIGLEPEEMVFIDDSQINVDASVAAGLPALHYLPGSDMAALLDDFLAGDGKGGAV